MTSAKTITCHWFKSTHSWSVELTGSSHSRAISKECSTKGKKRELSLKTFAKSSFFRSKGLRLSRLRVPFQARLRAFVATLSPI